MILEYINPSSLTHELCLPYHTSFQWLENDFLQYLDDWEDSNKQVQVTTNPEISNADLKKLCISEETLEGLRITGASKLKFGKFYVVHLFIPTSFSSK